MLIADPKALQNETFLKHNKTESATAKVFKMFVAEFHNVGIQKTNLIDHVLHSADEVWLLIKFHMDTVSITVSNPLHRF